MTMTIAFDNTYAALPQRFFARVRPAEASAPRLIKLNRPLAAELGLDADWLTSPAGVAVLAGRSMPDGAASIAAAYAGHQFGNFVPQLGDGRAILLGEVVGRDGQRRDLQLKGSGRTPFSRGGDGKAALGPVLREYIVSEAMAALGIPTTRALAAVLTGDAVMRETVMPGAVLTRVAASHIRVGTFQFFAAREDVEGLRVLADYVIARHYPEAAEAANPYLTLLEAVIARQAALIARWLLVGFIHGVMNTDNMAVAGETIDYGPCAFLDEYDPGTVFSSIDQQGRYAYGNQPRIALWNLTRLAETLLPLLDADPERAVADAEGALKAFAPTFEAHYHAGLRRKLGLFEEREGDLQLAGDLLKRMAENSADFTLTFRHLTEAAGPDGDAGPVRSRFIDPTSFDAWAEGWRTRLAQDGQDAANRRAALRAVNPAFVPRNHRVEAAIQAGLRDDFQPFEDLVAVLSRPYDDQPDAAAYMDPPAIEERVTQTFCGT